MSLVKNHITVKNKSKASDATDIINKFVMFSYNYPMTFANGMNGKNPILIDIFGKAKGEHYCEKFNEFYKSYHAMGVMSAFFKYLDKEDKVLLTDWIMNNYNG